MTFFLGPRAIGAPPAPLPPRLRRTAGAGALLLLSLAFEASALGVGRPQGAPLIGRPLQLNLPVTLQPGEEPCVKAQLVQGEEQPTALQSRLENRGDGTGVLRLFSSGLVQEPVVTLRLVLGCADQLIQTHVLLADLPPASRESLPLVDRQAAPAQATTGAVAPPAAPGIASPATGTVMPPGESAARASRSEARTGPASEATAASAPRRPAPERRRRTADAAPAKAPVAARPAGGSRLQVDLMDVAIDQAPALKVSGQMAPASAPALTRSQAQAAWQEINAPAAEQMAALQRQSEATLAELRSLRETSRRQAELLERVSTERNLMRDVLAGIAGAVALFLGLLLWRRGRDGAGAQWWQGQRAAVPLKERSLHATDSSFVDSSYPEPPSAVAPPPEEDSGWSHYSHPGEDSPREAPSPAPATKGGFTDSAFGKSRLPSADELLDVQEKANFFLAVGQPDQAIQMLEARLMEHLGGSPFLWLDLLDLCRRHGRAADYERVRKEFQKAFSARLPAFNDAKPNTEGLERYPRALSRITLLWPSSRVLKEIEKSLFEDPAAGSIMFDLEASRDLLLLYSIAHDVVNELSDGKPHVPTALVGLAEDAMYDPDDPHVTQPVPLMALDVEEASTDEPDLALDVDFSRLEGRGAFPSLMPVPMAEPPAPAAVPAPSASSAVTAQRAAVDVDLDFSDLPPAPQVEPEPSLLLDDLILERRRPAVNLMAADQLVDKTPPEPPMLAELQLDGLSLEKAAPPPPPAEEPPLPTVLDFDVSPAPVPEHLRSK